MENPIINNRIINDYTFAVRLKRFINNVEVNSAIEYEEKEYLYNIASNLLIYQIDSSSLATYKEKEYLSQVIKLLNK